MPAPLEIPAVTNSIPPSAIGEVPVAAPEITAVPPPPPPPTPSDILGLSGKEHAKERAKAEKCLANAVYFEARGEPLRGQVAVAQVVLNRVFSPYYPKDVCGVVYQNAERHLSCQFTFACDGRSKAITERGAWWRAQRIAKRMLDGTVWVANVAKSTHYHAYWVSPSWVSEMKKMYHYGVHTFYRPVRWGDGSQEAGWVQPQPASGQTEIKPQPQVKPVTSNQTNPSPASMQAKAVAVESKAKLLPADTQLKASKADSKSKLLPANTQAKASTSDRKVKPLPQGTQPKESKTDSKAKPQPANKQAKALPKNVQAKLVPNSRTKPLLTSSQAKSSQKVSSQ